MFREDKILLTLYLGASLVAQMVKTLHAIQKPGWDPWIGKIPWRRKRQPTPVFLPGKFHGQRSLVGYSPWGRKELGMTEQLEHAHMHYLPFGLHYHSGQQSASSRVPYTIIYFIHIINGVRLHLSFIAILQIIPQNGS